MKSQSGRAPGQKTVLTCDEFMQVSDRFGSEETMRVYAIDLHEGLLSAVRTGDDRKGIPRFTGKSLVRSWKPCPVQLYFANKPLKNTGLNLTFAWAWDHILCLGTEGMRVMAPLLAPHGEFLPLECDQAQLVLFNPLVTVKEDERRSEMYGKGLSLSFSAVRSPAFKSAKEIKAPVFRIERRFWNHGLVTQEIVDRARAAKLKDVDFRLCWSDEPGVAPEAPADRGWVEFRAHTRMYTNAYLERIGDVIEKAKDRKETLSFLESFGRLIEAGEM
jgi:hypothetical protein